MPQSVTAILSLRRLQSVYGGKDRVRWHQTEPWCGPASWGSIDSTTWITWPRTQRMSPKSHTSILGSSTLFFCICWWWNGNQDHVYKIVLTVYKVLFNRLFSLPVRSYMYIYWLLPLHAKIATVLLTWLCIALLSYFFSNCRWRNVKNLQLVKWQRGQGLKIPSIQNQKGII